MKTPTAFSLSAQGCPLRAGYPGSASPNIINPEGVESSGARFDAAPLGLKLILERSPRVVAPRLSGSDLQPWAELLYPFGVMPPAAPEAENPDEKTTQPST